MGRQLRSIPSSEDDRLTIKWYAVDCLVELDRYAEAFRRFGDDLEFAITLGERLVTRRRFPEPPHFDSLLASSEQPTAAMLDAYLRANSAAAAGDGEACDAHWQTCLHEAERLIGNPDDYLLSHLVDSYARQMIALEQAPQQINDSSSVLWESLVEAACDETAKLQDHSTSVRLQQQIAGVEDEWTESRLTEMHARMAMAEHRWGDAILQYVKHTDPTSADLTTLSPMPPSDLIFEAHIRQGEAALAQAWIEDSEGDPLRETLVHLTSGAYESLIPGHADESPVPLGSSFFHPLLRPLLFGKPQQVRDLIDQWDVEIVSIPTQWSAILLQSEPIEIDADWLRTRLSRDLGWVGRLQVVPISSSHSPSSKHQWMVREEGELSMIVSIDPGPWYFARFTDQQRRTFGEQQQVAIGIELIYSKRPFAQHGMNILAQLASEETIAIADRTRNYLWMRNDEPWLYRMTWKRRIPVDADTMTDAYLVAGEKRLEPAEQNGSASLTTSQGMNPIEQESLMKIAASTDDDLTVADRTLALPARLQLVAGTAEEWIPVLAFGYDQTADTVTVRLQEDSQIFPPLTAGSELRAATHRLSRTE